MKILNKEDFFVNISTISELNIFKDIVRKTSIEHNIVIAGHNFIDNGISFMKIVDMLHKKPNIIIHFYENYLMIIVDINFYNLTNLKKYTIDELILKLKKIYYINNF